MALGAAAQVLRARLSVVFCYHGVAPTNLAEDPGFLRTPPSQFRAHLDLLLEAGFEFVTVAEFARRAAGGAPPPGVAALSFDDGMDDNHEHLLPILREYGIPATVYVASGLIGQANPFMAQGSGARMMTEQELRALVEAGVEIGAHTVNHADLTRLDRAECLHEVAESREALQRITGAQVETFAYPWCRYDQTAIDAVRSAGFMAAVTCHGRGSWAPYEIKRALITGKDGRLSLLLKIADVYDSLFHSPPGRLVRVTTRRARRQARKLQDARLGHRS